MTYTLDDFCNDTRTALISNPGHAGRDEVRQHLEQLLKNKEFLDEYCGPDAENGVHTLFEDKVR